MKLKDYQPTIPRCPVCNAYLSYMATEARDSQRFAMYVVRTMSYACHLEVEHRAYTKLTGPDPHERLEGEDFKVTIPCEHLMTRAMELEL